MNNPFRAMKVALFAMVTLTGCAVPVEGDPASGEKGAEHTGEASSAQVLAPTITVRNNNGTVTMSGSGFTPSNTVETFAFYQSVAQWSTGTVQTTAYRPPPISCGGVLCLPFFGGTFSTPLACNAQDTVTYYGRDLATGRWSNGVTIDIACPPR